MRLCAKYEDIILLHFFGHHSKELLRSYRIPLDVERNGREGRHTQYRNVSYFVTGGMAPRHNYRPFYAHMILKRWDGDLRDVAIERKPLHSLCAPHFQSVSLKTFSISLEDIAPLASANGTLPEWKKWYDFDDAYDVADFSTSSIAAAVGKIAHDGRYMQKYMDLQANLPGSTTYSEMYCGLTNFRKDDYKACVSGLCGKKKEC